MTDLVVRAVMTGDGKGLVGAADEATQAVRRLRTEGDQSSNSYMRSAAGSKEVKGASEAAGNAAKAATSKTSKLDEALFHLGGGIGFQVGRVRDFGRGLGELAEYAGTARVAVGGVAAAITAVYLQT